MTTQIKSKKRSRTYEPKNKKMKKEKDVSNKRSRTYEPKSKKIKEEERLPLLQSLPFKCDFLTITREELDFKFPEVARELLPCYILEGPVFCCRICLNMYFTYEVFVGHYELRHPPFSTPFNWDRIPCLRLKKNHNFKMVSFD